ncbi:hypothetical protein COOONC_09455, partial [Cooperia oncophora]
LTDLIDKTESSIRSLSEDPNLFKLHERNERKRMKKEKTPRRDESTSITPRQEVQRGPSPRARSPPRSPPNAGKVVDFHKLLASRSSHQAEWILGKTPPKQPETQTTKQPSTANAGQKHKFDWILQTEHAKVPPPTQGSAHAPDQKEPDLNKLHTSDSTHHEGWNLGGTTQKKQAAQTAQGPARTEQEQKHEWALRTEHEKDAKELPPHHDPTPSSHGKDADFHKLVAIDSTHHAEYILGGERKPKKENRAVKPPGKAGPPPKSEWIIQTEHVKDTHALTPARSPYTSEYQAEKTQSEEKMQATSGVREKQEQENVLLKSPKPIPQPCSLSREIFNYDNVPDEGADEQELSPSTVKSEILPRGQKAICLMSNLKVRGRHGPLSADERANERTPFGSESGNQI